MTRWRYGALAALALVLVSLVPHLYFFYKRGGDWNGSPPLTHGDEVVYAAYLNALIDGRPRRSDPYTGRDDSDASPLPESYFSIQFLPPTVLAAVSRTLGASSLQSFFALTLFSAAASALALFWLMRGVLADERAAAACAVTALCLGSAHLAVIHAFGGENPNNYLAFLRRYVPTAALPFFFTFCALVWRALGAGSQRSALAAAACAGASFAVLVYSYFYLWTAALAWLFCLSLLWLLARRDERVKSLKTLGLVWGLAGAALVPYFALLSNRVASTDEALLLARTRAPDLLRLPELLGFVTLIGLTFAVRAGRVKAGDRAVLFVASLALTPFVVFNQQVLTGRSLQPFHYGIFGVNYLTLAAALMAAVLIWKGRGERAGGGRFRAALAALAVAALAWGAFEGLLAGRRHLPGNTLRGAALPAMRRLGEEGRAAGRLDTRSLVFCTDVTVADALPTVAPQPVLWAPHMFNFPGVSLEEDRERLRLYLYFAGVRLDDIDPNGYEDLDRFRKYFISSLISRGRHNPQLRAGWTPITPGEVESAVRGYADFAATIDRARVERLPITFVLTSPEERVDFTNLDRWYERDGGERVGSYVIYRVKLRPAG